MENDDTRESVANETEDGHVVIEAGAGGESSDEDSCENSSESSGQESRSGDGESEDDGSSSGEEDSSSSEECSHSDNSNESGTKAGNEAGLFQRFFSARSRATSVGSVSSNASSLSSCSSSSSRTSRTSDDVADASGQDDRKKSHSSSPAFDLESQVRKRKEPVQQRQEKAGPKATEKTIASKSSKQRGQCISRAKSILMMVLCLICYFVVMQLWKLSSEAVIAAKQWLPFDSDRFFSGAPLLGKPDRKYSNAGRDFDPKLRRAEPLRWSEFRSLIRPHDLTNTRSKKGITIPSLGPKMTRPVKNNKRRSFGCLRDGCRGLEIEDFLDRGWSMRFKTCLVNGTRDYKDINYHQTFLMADTTNLNHLESVRPDLFTKIHDGYQGSSYITAFDGGDAIGGNKGQQLRVKTKFARKHSCKYNDLGIQPAQYRLYIEEECSDLIRLDSGSLGLTWLLKPEAGSQGQGITFHTSVDSIRDKRPGFFPCKTTHHMPATERALVQEYIEKPLLLHDTKFDARVYMLIGSADPFFVFYHEGYLRRSLWTYSPNSKDRKVYLTNTHFQSMKAGFKLSDHIWSFETFQTYLNERGVTGAHYIDTVLNPYIKAVLAYVFHSARAKIKPRPGSYQILGLDFMIDADFHVHFIEANGYPGFTWSINFDSRKMVEELHDLVQELHEQPAPFPHMRSGDRFASWQLVFSEMQDAVRGIKYNPCEEFADNFALSAPQKHANKLFGKISGSHRRASTAKYDDAARFVPKIPGWRRIGGEKGDTFAVRKAFAEQFLLDKKEETDGVHGTSMASKSGQSITCSGDSYASWAIEPRTFRLYIPEECKALFSSRLGETAWIAKQVEGGGSGDGLVWFASLDDLRLQFPDCPSQSDDAQIPWLAQPAIARPMRLDVGALHKAERINIDAFASADKASDRREMAKKMEANIELINPGNPIYTEYWAYTNDRKDEEELEEEGEQPPKKKGKKKESGFTAQYDVRVYMLVASLEPLMVFYHDGYFRSSRPAVFSDDYFGFALGEHAITFDSFQYYLASQQITGPHYVSSVLRPHLFKVMEFLLHSARQGIAQDLESYKGVHNATGTHFHHLFALNFVIDSNFGVHLTGVSGDTERDQFFPVEEMEHVSREVKAELARLDRLRREVVLEIATAPAAFARMRYGDAYDSFRLVFSEIEERRYSTKYNPCAEFRANPKPISPAQHRKTANLQGFLDKQRKSHLREMDKYVKKRWASCKLRGDPKTKIACIEGEIIYRYLIYLNKERLPFDRSFIENKIIELQHFKEPSLPEWKIQTGKNK